MPPVIESPRIGIEAIYSRRTPESTELDASKLRRTRNDSRRISVIERAGEEVAITALRRGCKVLLEAAIHLRRDRALLPFERVAQKSIGKVFKRQGAAMLRALPQFSGYFQEATPSKVLPPPIDHEWDAIADETASEFTKALTRLSSSALVVGAKVASDDLGIALRFDLKNPRAEAFMREHGADLVTKINETTRDELKTLLSEAIDEGWSYTQTAKAIRDEFEGFSRERAKTVAVTESAFAYEGGQRQMAAALVDAGLEIEKSWLAEDTCCDDCAANADQGWIPEDEDFDGGVDGPPQHPKCRCASLTRRAQPEEE